MPNINALMDSKWLKASHLEDRNWKVIIDSVDLAEFENKDGSKERKAVLNIRGWTKSMTLNVTNLKQIAKVMGSEDTDDWAGRGIELFVTDVNGPSGIVPGIRVMNREVPASDVDSDVPAACVAVPID